jgi:mannose-6-phosphate isomerase-like protein (cupin superfamily)
MTVYPRSGGYAIDYQANRVAARDSGDILPGAAECGNGGQLTWRTKEKTMQRAVSSVSIGLAGILLSMGGTQLSIAADAAPKTQLFSAAQLKALVAHPVDGVAAKQFLNGPGSNVYFIYRDKTGETEVHTALNDIFIVKSGHAKITIGGQVTGNRETVPTEWRGGEITGGTDYALAPGDVLFIPAGLPHKLLLSPKTSITYVTVKTQK